MTTSEFIEPSGMMSGFHYHDQSLENMNFENNLVKLTIKTDGGKIYELKFKEIYNLSIQNYFSKNIIRSCFIWKFLDLPCWFKENKQLLNAVNYCSIDTKFLFYLDSSYGASVFIPFNQMILSEMGRGALFELN